MGVDFGDTSLAMDTEAMEGDDDCGDGGLDLTKQFQLTSRLHSEADENNVDQFETCRVAGLEPDDLYGMSDLSNNIEEKVSYRSSNDTGN